MGRPRLSEETNRNTMIQIIEVTRKLIETDGLSNIAIRRIAAEAGVNSATIYKYFQDLDELVLFACVNMYKEYIHEMEQNQKLLTGMTAREKYLFIWELFCRHSFRSPDSTNHFFFSRHSDNLEHVIRTYYDLFPDELEDLELKAMLRTPGLAERNMDLLRPVLLGKVTEENLNFVNELTLAYYRMLLEMKLSEKEACDNRMLTEKMLDACRFLLDSIG